MSQSNKKDEGIGVNTDGHISNLMFVLCTKSDNFSHARIQTIIKWITDFREKYRNDPSKYSIQSVANCIRCIASILWEVHMKKTISDLPGMITNAYFDMIVEWSQSLQPGAKTMKQAVDGLICSVCYIRPEFFNVLLQKMGVLILDLSAGPNQYETVDLTELRLTSDQLETIAVACQSPDAAKRLIESELLGLLTFAVLEFTEREISKIIYLNTSTSTVLYPMVNVVNVIDILNMFAMMCSEGTLRDWFGLTENSKFWERMLHLLCNGRMSETKRDVTRMSYMNLEDAVINFMSCVMLCHPSNQGTFIAAFTYAIREGNGKDNNPKSKSVMSAFTRKLALKTLLENQKILVSVRTELPLHNSNNIVNQVFLHPSMMPNPYHLVFHADVYTKSSQILEKCCEKYDNILDNGQIDFTNIGFGLYANLLKAENGESLTRVNAIVTAFIKNFYEMFETKYDDREMISKTAENGQLFHISRHDLVINSDCSLAQILRALKTIKANLSSPCINLVLKQDTTKVCTDSVTNGALLCVSNHEKLSSPLEGFSTHGSLTLLARHLPTVTVEEHKGKSPTVSNVAKRKKENENREEDLTMAIDNLTVITSVPQQSLAAFALFLKLPAYTEFLLNNLDKARCMLRLILGVSRDGDGTEIYTLPIASALPSYPFEAFRDMLENNERKMTESVSYLRQTAFEVGTIHLILNCLSAFSHNVDQLVPGTHELQENIREAATSTKNEKKSEEKGTYYWPKGTGYGTGTKEERNESLTKMGEKQKFEDNQVAVLLQILARYISPKDRMPGSAAKNVEVLPELPPIFSFLIEQSCLCKAICCYLRNDSILDIKKRIPLYRSILQLIRAISFSRTLLHLLTMSFNTDSHNTIASSLSNLKGCMDAYRSRLKATSDATPVPTTAKYSLKFDRKNEDGDEEGLVLFEKEVQITFELLQQRKPLSTSENRDTFKFVPDKSAGETKPEKMEIAHEEPKPVPKNENEDLYVAVMQKFRFDTYDMVKVDDSGTLEFLVSHYYNRSISGSTYTGRPARMRRLAQETVTLTTSLPISFNSSVFVRCDTNRLDAMKVLITGPTETPYANGCFEFDVHFTNDYPNSPMQVHLATTGVGTVRFNPNLYACGKVCLSILNTWSGGATEKWNPQTSTFLQVLVSIQSLILVPDPYFNEPGFERSLNKPEGIRKSREYNSNIRQATVRWAMLAQLRNPPACFKEVILAHFWLKKDTICTQIEGWISEMAEWRGEHIAENLASLRKLYAELQTELSKLKKPSVVDEISRAISTNAIPSSSTATVATGSASRSQNVFTATNSECIPSTSTTKKTENDIFADFEDEMQEELNNFYAFENDDEASEEISEESSDDEN